MAHHLVAALYKFVSLSELSSLQSSLLDKCKTEEVMGTILLASEGINGTISGPEDGVRAVLKWLRDHSEFQDLDVKESWSETAPFHRMKVRLKSEIVTLGAADLDAANNAGTYVEPADWNELISRPDVVVVDTRNDYEVSIGTFEGATDPKTTSFRDFPKWVDEKLEADPNTNIAMFCTGGIRCEKSTALLKSKGYHNVFHLKGGILKYLETVSEDESLWKGECFVFDQRVSVQHGLVPGHFDMCHACRMPISQEDMNHEAYQIGVSCPHCFDTIDDAKRQRLAERQRQMELAESRNNKHIAADISAAKRQKRQDMLNHKERSRLGTVKG